MSAYVLEAPAAWYNQHHDGVSPEPVDRASAWWEQLGDEQLARYIQTAVQENHDIAIATARIREARAARRIAGSGLWPQGTVTGLGQRSGLSETGGSAGSELVEFGVADPYSEFYRIGFDASWELDLFGRNRREGEAAGARLLAAEASHRDVLISVIAEVARNYVELRGAQRRIVVTEHNIRTQRASLEVVEDLYATGLVPELDVYRARQQLAQTQARLPPLRLAMRRASHRLAVLLGQPPGALATAMSPPRPVPSPPDLVPVGLPSELLTRRPDLRAARHQLHAATADVGVAIARLYPSFSLTGASGVESDRFSDLFQTASETWSVGTNIAWPVLTGGRLRGNVAASRARLEAARLQYRQAVLRAWEEVETNLVGYAEAQLEVRRLDAAAVAARSAHDRARVRFDAGLTDYLNLLDAERTLTEAEDRLVRAETTLTLRLISLYKALGGGWRVATAGTQ